MFTPEYNILEEYLNKIIWKNLSSNENAIHLLEKNIDKIDWMNLSLNKNIMQFLTYLDTKKMKDNCKKFAEELAQYVFHPARLHNISELYNTSVYDYLELI